jgi:arginine decarboxylase-like protein
MIESFHFWAGSLKRNFLNLNLVVKTHEEDDCIHLVHFHLGVCE